MAVRIYFFIVFRNVALRVDQEGLPFGDRHTHIFRLYPIGIGGGAFGICKQREGQAVLFREFLMRILVVQADAQNLAVEVFERENVVAKFTGFGGATRCVVFGIEIQGDPLAAIVLDGM